MGNQESGIFRDTRERTSKVHLKDALLSGKTLTLREVSKHEEREGVRETACAQFNDLSS